LIFEARHFVHFATAKVISQLLNSLLQFDRYQQGEAAAFNGSGDAFCNTMMRTGTTAHAFVEATIRSATAPSVMPARCFGGSAMCGE
jgi:hypothetical protein